MRGNNTSSQARPIQERRDRTCITVRYKKRRIDALVDTGSEITIAGAKIAKKLRWKVRSCEPIPVKAANGKEMLLTGIAN